MRAKSNKTMVWFLTIVDSAADSSVLTIMNKLGDRGRCVYTISMDFCSYWYECISVCKYYVSYGFHLIAAMMKTTAE